MRFQYMEPYTEKGICTARFGGQEVRGSLGSQQHLAHAASQRQRWGPKKGQQRGISGLSQRGSSCTLGVQRIHMQVSLAGFVTKAFARYLRFGPIDPYH